ncbi:MAG: Asp-tRNA(Asn)/Glu-tRNA(Gln) amidotransferase subunit GatB, partial [Balneolaceae bacterium]
AYLSKIKQIVQYLEICDGNMEEGSLRCDANVSVRLRGQEKLGTRTELKNMNSFRNVERAIHYEIYRQIELIEKGGEVIQQTRLWNTTKNETRLMRSKEEAHDYRYFPEPDLPPVLVTGKMLEEIKAELPELADVRQKRFMEEYKMSELDAITLTESRYLADYYEEVVKYLGNPKAASSIVLSEVLRILNEQSIDIREFEIAAERISELVKLKEEDKVNSSALQEIFNAMLESNKYPEDLAKEMNLIQVSDSGFLEPIVDEIITNNPDEVKRYQEGKKQLMGFFVGQAMKASRGKANPKMITDLITKKLSD